MNEEQFRKILADMFLIEYLPKINKEFHRFMDEAYERQKASEIVSSIVGRPVGINLGVLKVAAPTNEMIDKLVKLYVQNKN